MATTLVGSKAPKFISKAVIVDKIIENFSLEDFEGRNIVFFFYPLNFTFVCPTELHAFQEMAEEFESYETQIVGCSVDSCYSHLAWLNTPKQKGGVQGVTFPLVSDINKSIAREFGVLAEKEGIAYRGLFLIDKKNIVRHAVVNDFPLGRSVEETLRMVHALRHFEKNGEVCPANWQVTKSRSFEPTSEGVQGYFAAG